MTDIWDDPSLASDYVKFETVGDGVTGEIIEVAKHTFEDGKVAPKLVIDIGAGDIKVLTAGQAQLKAKLIELRPKVGDTITVRFTGTQNRGGGKTLKEFDVEVDKAKAGAASDAPF